MTITQILLLCEGDMYVNISHYPETFSIFKPFSIR